MDSNRPPGFGAYTLLNSDGSLAHWLRASLEWTGHTIMRPLLRWLFPYKSIPELLALMDPVHRDACEHLLHERPSDFETAPGSRFNHQAWVGGYQAHMAEGMNIAIVLWTVLNAQRALPFSLSSLLFCFFWHDVEKLEKYKQGSGTWKVADGLKTKDEQRARREELYEHSHVILTEEERIALRYAEGENKDYHPEKRVMNELGALLHACDVLSARLWHGHPQREDTWTGSERYAHRD